MTDTLTTDELTALSIGVSGLFSYLLVLLYLRQYHIQREQADTQGTQATIQERQADTQDTQASIQERQTWLMEQELASEVYSHPLVGVTEKDTVEIQLGNTGRGAIRRMYLRAELSDMEDIGYSAGVRGLSEEDGNLMISPMTEERPFTASVTLRPDSSDRGAPIVDPLREKFANGAGEATLVLTVLAVDSLTEEEEDDVRGLEVARESIDISDGVRGHHLKDPLDYTLPEDSPHREIENLAVALDEGK